MRVSELNPYARFFRSLKGIDVSEDTRIILNQHTVRDQRVYNAPTSDEVAVTWPETTSSSESFGPHILVYGKSATSHRIYHHYGCYDPLQYPLLFPYGECGWNQGLKKKSCNGRGQAAVQTEPVMTCAVQNVDDLLQQEASRASNRRTRADNLISPREYYAYKLQIRTNNMLLRGGKCFQQYIVDMYVKVENTRLDFFRNNQDSIRAD
ncbi:uncharacterized protein LOC110740285 [Chenopodium quinoa]|uniref:uncharacterized protein LOC110740285 n=1 Tax=Chenopodium quinoa TaxID=63459 RepID=UPI000B793BEE|nr:uncharacterized protein LOC110740285 [Chenopodium quinoa]XP_021776456.1 uncharacterized protein LOC110740285 [Chenopodium quinoa]